MMDPSSTPDQINAMAKNLRQSMTNEPATTFLHEQNAMVASLVKTPDKRPQVIFWDVNSDRHTFTTAMYEDVITDARPQISKIEAPITVLYAFNAATQSQKTTDKEFHDAYAAAPHATLIRIDDSAHFIMLDQPQKFDDAVQKFLKS
jgi:pimeloyl-ACP methyl ester carboxylesterase